jgi:hypothetical protein
MNSKAKPSSHRRLFRRDPHVGTLISCGFAGTSAPSAEEATHRGGLFILRRRIASGGPQVAPGDRFVQIIISIG